MTLSNTLVHNEVSSYHALFMALAEEIDISAEDNKAAVEKYREIGDWLCAESSMLTQWSPEVFPQGSFRLGTVVQPISGKGEYDIDLVCQLAIDKESTTKEELKHLVGERLKQNPQYRPLLQERRRCWTLVYDKSFHIDILPAITNTEKSDQGLWITDRELHKWQSSNPKGFAEWFKAQSLEEYRQERVRLAKVLTLSVEDVPEWQVKTNLQRVVQILKWHRNVHFQRQPDIKPVSIIITTLAAQAYQPLPDLFDTFKQVAINMRQHIGHDKNFNQVLNPVDPSENFADKWREHPKRREAFFKWLAQLERDVTELKPELSLPRRDEVLEGSFGKTMKDRALHRMAYQVSEQLKNARLGVTATGSLSTTAPSHNRHNFYGDS